MPKNQLHTPSSTLDADTDPRNGYSQQQQRESPPHFDSKFTQPNGGLDHDDDDFDFYDEEDPLTDMPSDLRPPFHRPTDGRSQTPLLSSKRSRNGSLGGLARPSTGRRKSSMKERDPDVDARAATRKRYTYAAFFLVLSLISFAVQTETAVYIKKYLGWKKSYAML